MQSNRLEAFSDGVLAIIITIMVLELKAPKGSSLEALIPLIPVALGYILSFIYVGIYWNNHHHLFQITERVSGAVLWANLSLLFWLSLFPFATAWVGQNPQAPVPCAAYGLVLALAGFSYFLLQSAIIAGQGAGSLLAAALGRDWKGKGSVLMYLLAIGLAFVNPWISYALYIGVAIVWVIPDRRIERALEMQDRIRS
jgi:uncharacterized membrane protein